MEDDGPVRVFYEWVGATRYLTGPITNGLTAWLGAACRRAGRRTHLAGRAISGPPAHAELLQATQGMMVGSRALSSLAQYQNPWLAFCKFCAEGKYVALPAHPLVVAMFLTAVAKSAASYAVVKTASAAIFTHHEMAGVEAPPTKHMMCKGVRAAAKRQLGLAVRNRKEPLTLEDAGAIAQLLLAGVPRLHDLMIAT